MNKSRRDDNNAPGSQSLNQLGKTKTHWQIKSLECEASLINLKELIEKEKKRRSRRKKCKGIVKFVVLDVYQVSPVPYN